MASPAAIHTSLALPPDLRDAVRAWGADRALSVSDVTRLALVALLTGPEGRAVEIAWLHGWGACLDAFGRGDLRLPGGAS